MTQLALTMIGHQLVASLLLLLLATWQVRPAFRRQDGAPAFGQGLSGTIRRRFRRWRPRRPCGDAAMLWKETHGTPGSMLVNLVSYLTVLGIGICVFEALKEAVPHAWEALITDGYRLGSNSVRRQELNIILRGMNTALFCVLTLVLGALASTSISREREDDTWISLISTPLDGPSILTAKLLGSVWAVRAMLVMIAAIWIFGLVMGVVHPLGVLLSAVQLSIFVLFVLALGTLVSLRARTTMRALGMTLGVVLFLSLGVPILWGIVGGHPFVAGWATSSPFLFAVGMLSYRDVGIAITRTIPISNYEVDFLDTMKLMLIFGFLFYLSVGLTLLFASYRGFERALDRPRRGEMVMPPSAESAGPAGGGRVAIPAGRAG